MEIQKFVQRKRKLLKTMTTGDLSIDKKNRNFITEIYMAQAKEDNSMYHSTIKRNAYKVGKSIITPAFEMEQKKKYNYSTQNYKLEFFLKLNINAKTGSFLPKEQRFHEYELYLIFQSFQYDFKRFKIFLHLYE